MFFILLLFCSLWFSLVCAVYLCFEISKYLCWLGNLSLFKIEEQLTIKISSKSLLVLINIRITQLSPRLLQNYMRLEKVAVYKFIEYIILAFYHPILLAFWQNRDCRWADICMFCKSSSTTILQNSQLSSRSSAAPFLTKPVYLLHRTAQNYSPKCAQNYFSCQPSYFYCV